MKMLKPRQTKLINGASITMLPFASGNRVYVALVFDCGMQYFNLKERQLPHLLEHLMLVAEGGQDINELLSPYSAVANAQTDEEHIIVSFETPVRHSSQVIELILKAVFKNSVSEVTVNNERSITVREAIERYDGISGRLLNYLLHQLYDNQFHEAWDEMLDDIKHLSFQRINDLYRSQICPQNLKVIIAGPKAVIDSDDIKKKIENIDSKPDYLPLRPITNSRHASKILPIQLDLTDSSLIELAFPFPKTTSETERTALNLISLCLFDAPFATIPNLLRRMQSNYSIESDVLKKYNESVLLFIATLDAKHVDIATLAILETLEKAANIGFGKEQLANTKKLAISYFEDGFSSPADAIAWYLADITDERKLTSLSDVVRSIKTISNEDIQKTSRRLLAFSNIWGLVVSGDAAYWVEDMDKSLRQPVSERPSWSSLQEDINAKRAAIPIQNSMLYAAYLFLSYPLMMSIYLLSLIPLTGPNNTIAGWSLDHRSIVGMSLVIMHTVATVVMAFGSGRWTRLSQLLALALDGLSAIAFLWFIGVSPGGFSAVLRADSPWQSYLIWPIAVYFLGLVPIVILKFVRDWQLHRT